MRLPVSTLTYAEMPVGPLRSGQRAVELVERFVATGMRRGADVVLPGDARWRGLAKVRVLA